VAIYFPVGPAKTRRLVDDVSKFARSSKQPFDRPFRQLQPHADSSPRAPKKGPTARLLCGATTSQGGGVGGPLAARTTAAVAR